MTALPPPHDAGDQRRWQPPTMVELTPNDAGANRPPVAPAPSATPPPSQQPGQSSQTDFGPPSSGGRGRRAAAAGLLVVAMVGSGVVGAIVANELDDDGGSASPSRASSASIDLGERPETLPAVDVAAVAAHVGPSVVTISADVEGGLGEIGQSVGTGVITTSDGEILTNAHVVEGASEIRVRLAGESEPRTATLLAEDIGNDLALLRIDGDNFPAAEFADADSIQIGDEVVAIGFALDLDGAPSVTRGIVSALDRTITTGSDAVLDGLIQTDAAISSGNSGGPLVNALGQVVGINTAVARGDTFTAATNIGFAISVDEALPIVDSLREQAEGEPREEGYLGVTLADRTDGGQGAIIDSVEPDTPAAAAGLEPGDIVIEIDDAPIEGIAGLVAAIRDLEPGDEVHVVALRDGDQMEFTVTLAARATS
jgi:S1-C subfamily serine protease